MPTPRIIVLMGVAGSGKTTVGRALADSLGWMFSDADDFHPPANIAKLSAGLALTDADRAPWLTALRNHLDARLAAGLNTVLACSALKAAYRERLIADPDVVQLVYLNGTPELLAARIGARNGHFAPPTLLASQLATLEAPNDALVLDITASPQQLVADIRRHCRLES
jgi:gluconokinase